MDECIFFEDKLEDISDSMRPATDKERMEVNLYIEKISKHDSDFTFDELIDDE